MNEKRIADVIYNSDFDSFPDIKVKKEIIIKKMKERGCRITKQRLVIIDIILENECYSCKEIYYEVMKVDPKIGAATVYRMINTLEEIGAINRRNRYRLTIPENSSCNEVAEIKLDDNTVFNLSAKVWNSVIEKGLTAMGYRTHQNIASIQIKERFEQ